MQLELTLWIYISFILQLQLPIIYQMSSTINFLIDKENLDQQVVLRLDLAESALDPD